jgi:hypothetical protein
MCKGNTGGMDTSYGGGSVVGDGGGAPEIRRERLRYGDDHSAGGAGVGGGARLNKRERKHLDSLSLVHDPR